jgi:hypothetical protein
MMAPQTRGKKQQAEEEGSKSAVMEQFGLPGFWDELDGSKIYLLGNKYSHSRTIPPYTIQ